MLNISRIEAKEEAFSELRDEGEVEPSKELVEERTAEIIERWVSQSMADWTDGHEHFPLVRRKHKFFDD